MAQGRWTQSDEQLAQEAYAVLILGEKASRTFPRATLTEALSDPSIYLEFIKLCLEYDDSNDLKILRRGLLHIVQAIGVTPVAKAVGISRMSLYRMLSKGGNPRLNNLQGLFQALGLRFWLVDHEFIKKRERFVRPRERLPVDLTQSQRRRAFDLMS